MAESFKLKAYEKKGRPKAGTPSRSRSLSLTRSLLRGWTEELANFKVKLYKPVTSIGFVFSSGTSGLDFPSKRLRFGDFDDSDIMMPVMMVMWQGASVSEGGLGPGVRLNDSRHGKCRLDQRRHEGPA
jgi:hypothetical protein